jgi:oligoribonuclease
MPPSSQTSSAPIVWVDLEMTGLEPGRHAIVEIATLITDGELRVLAEGPSLVIHQPEEVLSQMDDYVRQMHTRSGLLDKIRASTVSLADAEEATAAFVERHAERGQSVLAGNSVWKDREFLSRSMPRVLSLLHYRILDVSTVKELARRWSPAALYDKKKERHRALDDIHESLDELRHYRATMFRS